MSSDIARSLAGLKGAVPSGPGGRPMLFCGDIDMRIGRDGTWYYLGSPIGRKPLVKLFATVLRREDDGDYYLVTPVERCRIRVDDAPFVAVEVDVADGGDGRALVFRTNLDEQVTADAAHPIRVRVDSLTGEPTPYVLVRAGLEALIARPVFYQLVGMADTRLVDGQEVLGVVSAGRFFSLGRLDGKP
ncbi:MAG: DUF1285 domain-containing protein [Alphaproteobacteria bacterium]|nr:DUF1285 domain-containing protein [Alphaproteobacteria bacterium]